MTVLETEERRSRFTLPLPSSQYRSKSSCVETKTDTAVVPALIRAIQIKAEEDCNYEGDTLIEDEATTSSSVDKSHASFDTEGVR